MLAKQQCATILNLFQNRGVASNLELSKIALKYTSRISDLRRRMHDIRVTRRDYQTGYTEYTYFGLKKHVPIVFGPGR
jgi:hypothetical protein